MKTLVSDFIFPGTSQRLVKVDFDPATFQPADFRILPHYKQLSHTVDKRQAEHLAGRIAAQEALRLQGITGFIPGIDLHHAPCWPPGFTGSITHTGHQALASVIPDSPYWRAGIGIDCEAVMTPETAQDIYGGIIQPAENTLLLAAAQPFHYALTLVFSAKESLFKALFRHVGRYFDFLSVSLTAIEGQQIDLTLNHALGPYEKGDSFTVFWDGDDRQLITLIQLDGE